MKKVQKKSKKGNIISYTYKRRY